MSEEEFFNKAINRICKDYDYNFANEFKLLFLKKDKEIERLKEENNELKRIYKNTCKHLFNIGNNELARYFQAQINECNVFSPQDLRGDIDE